MNEKVNIEYWLIAFIILLLMNITSCIYLTHQNEYEKNQKILQCIIVWLLPFLGAAGIFLLVRSLNEPVQKNKPPFGGGSNNSGSISNSGGDNS